MKVCTLHLHHHLLTYVVHSSSAILDKQLFFLLFRVIEAHRGNLLSFSFLVVFIVITLLYTTVSARMEVFP